jgi:hypothetical protein
MRPLRKSGLVRQLENRQSRPHSIFSFWKEEEEEEKKQKNKNK